ncbi:MAG: ribosome-associated translation inhibitor RaiA [Mycoplasmataceae bacterium]|jgi:ribosomal subunit interface protein|nr:ribosome-associated translation inhibitor RaiA [Mycoplasmataceae bacterium]
MTYTIRWKDCQKSNAVTSHFESKIARFEDFRFILPEVKAEIVYYPKNQSFTTRINLKVVKKGTIRAEANAHDVLTSINEAVDRIIDQLRRVKTQYEN